MSNNIRPAITREDLQVEMCRSDFERSFDKSVRSAGGAGTFKTSQSLTLRELRDLLATNGVRFNHGEGYEMSAYHVPELLVDAANALR
jgi:hypothetical protein